jgi:hypothetical protein
MTTAAPFQAKVMRDEGIRARWEGAREEGYVAMLEALATEVAAPFPPPLDSADSHRLGLGIGLGFIIGLRTPPTPTGAAQPDRIPALLSRDHICF